MPGMLQLAPPPALHDRTPITPVEQLDALLNAELALLARAVGEHLPVELADRVLAVRARRAALEAALDFAATRI
jgi:hypothetical protein